MNWYDFKTAQISGKDTTTIKWLWFQIERIARNSSPDRNANTKLLNVPEIYSKYTSFEYIGNIFLKEQNSTIQLVHIGIEEGRGKRSLLRPCTQTLSQQDVSAMWKEWCETKNTDKEIYLSLTRQRPKIRKKKKLSGQKKI